MIAMLPRMAPSKLIVAFTVAAVLILFIDSGVEAMQCTRRSIMGNVEYFNCPDSPFKMKAQYCCGTEMNRYCCKLSKAREHGYRQGGSAMNIDGKKVVKGIAAVLITILLVVGGCIALCCFCVCYMMRKKRTSAGRMVGGAGGSDMIGGQSVHVASNPGNGGAYQPQPSQQQPPSAYPSYPQPQQAGYQTAPSPYPSYPSYPMGNVNGGENPPPYPTGDKQPPYNPGYPQ